MRGDDRMHKYTFDSAVYTRKITAIGVFCAIILLYSVFMILNGKSPLVFSGAAIVAFYTVWETFVSLSNPKEVEIDKNGISFRAYGREHRYLWSDINSFRAKEFISAKKIFLRINKAGFLKGRYWLHCYYFSDGEELYRTIIKHELQFNPDSIKAWARNGRR